MSIRRFSKEKKISRSEIILKNGNGHGSTNTMIRRFLTVEKNVGKSMSLTQSATDGDSITINQNGVYAVCYGESKSNGLSAIFGLSKNSNELTTDILTITAAHRLVGWVNLNVNTQPRQCAAVFYALAGDVIRAHTNANVTGDDTSNGIGFHIVKISD